MLKCLVELRDYLYRIDYDNYNSDIVLMYIEKLDALRVVSYWCFGDNDPVMSHICVIVTDHLYEGLNSARYGVQYGLDFIEKNSDKFLVEPDEDAVNFLEGTIDRFTCSKPKIPFYGEDSRFICAWYGKTPKKIKEFTWEKHQDSCLLDYREDLSKKKKLKECLCKLVSVMDNPFVQILFLFISVTCIYIGFTYSFSYLYTYCYPLLILMVGYIILKCFRYNV